MCISKGELFHIYVKVVIRIDLVASKRALSKFYYMQSGYRPFWIADIQRLYLPSLSNLNTQGNLNLKLINQEFLKFLRIEKKFNSIWI